jgi:hypothetical protein
VYPGACCVLYFGRAQEPCNCYSVMKLVAPAHASLAANHVRNPSLDLRADFDGTDGLISPGEVPRADESRLGRSP